MRTSRVVLAVTVMVCLFAASAHGGTIQLFLSGLGAQDDSFSDFSWERVIDVDGDTLISANDILEGVFNFESVGVEGGTAGVNRMRIGRSDPVEATGYFKVKVQSVTPVGGVLYDIVIAPEPSFESVYGTGAMVAAFEGAGPTNNFDATKPIPQAILDATDGLHLVTLGFTGAPGEGWRAAGATNSILGAQLFGNSAFGFYQASLNTIVTPGMANDLLSLPLAKAEPSPFVPGTFTEFTVNGQLKGTKSGSTFPLSNSSDVFFTVIPEPATLVGLLTAALALMVGGWIRRKP